jgi:hypothetical protein
MVSLPGAGERRLWAAPTKLCRAQVPGLELLGGLFLTCPRGCDTLMILLLEYHLLVTPMKTLYLLGWAALQMLS